jgi:hypothetical protein
MTKRIPSDNRILAKHAAAIRRLGPPLPASRSMSSNGKRRVRRLEPYVCGKDTPQPGDEQTGGWSRERLVAMDEKFTRAVLRAFENGGEHRQSAAMNGANASRPR